MQDTLYQRATKHVRCLIRISIVSNSVSTERTCVKLKHDSRRCVNRKAIGATTVGTGGDWSPNF